MDWVRRRTWAAAAAALIVLPLASLPVVDAWRASRLRQADTSAIFSPPCDFRSLRLAGSLALQKKQLPTAIHLLRRAVASSPLDAESWRLLAATFKARDQADKQLNLLRLAGALTWRDAPTQSRLMFAAFQGDDMAAAVMHADALLRLEPDDQFGLAAMLTALDDPDARKMLADRLADKPAWRKLLFDNLMIAGDDDAQGLISLLRQMRTTLSPSTNDELGLAIAKLIGAGYGPLALDYWKHASGRPTDYDVLNSDSDFSESLPALQAGLSGPPFGWALAGGANVQVGGGRDFRGRRALTFDGPPDGIPQIVTRSILLSAGTYTLSFEASSDGQPTRRFLPRLTCIADGKTLPFETLRATESNGYLLNRITVTVPATCQALLLSFGLTASDDGQTHSFALRQVHWSRSRA